VILRYMLMLKRSVSIFRHNALHPPYIWDHNELVLQFALVTSSLRSRCRLQLFLLNNTHSLLSCLTSDCADFSRDFRNFVTGDLGPLSPVAEHCP